MHDISGVGIRNAQLYQDNYIFLVVVECISWVTFTRILDAGYATVQHGNEIKIGSYPLCTFVHCAHVRCAHSSVAYICPLRTFVRCVHSSVAYIYPLCTFVHCVHLSVSHIRPLRTFVSVAHIRPLYVMDNVVVNRDLKICDASSSTKRPSK